MQAAQNKTEERQALMRDYLSCSCKCAHLIKEFAKLLAPEYLLPVLTVWRSRCSLSKEQILEAVESLDPDTILYILMRTDFFDKRQALRLLQRCLNSALAIKVILKYHYSLNDVYDLIQKAPEKLKYYFTLIFKGEMKPKEIIELYGQIKNLNYKAKIAAVCDEIDTDEKIRMLSYMQGQDLYHALMSWDWLPWEIRFQNAKRLYAPEHILAFGEKYKLGESEAIALLNKVSMDPLFLNELKNRWAYLDIREMLSGVSQMAGSQLLQTFNVERFEAKGAPIDMSRPASPDSATLSQKNY
jgi:hypothetical protein